MGPIGTKMINVGRVPDGWSRFRKLAIVNVLTQFAVRDGRPTFIYVDFPPRIGAEQSAEGYGKATGADICL